MSVTSLAPEASASANFATCAQSLITLLNSGQELYSTIDSIAIQPFRLHYFSTHFDQK
jgi:hypothetical protein